MSYTNYKVGDKVICIHPSWRLQKDKEYTIVYILEDEHGQLVEVAGVYGVLWCALFRFTARNCECNFKEQEHNDTNI